MFAYFSCGPYGKNHCHKVLFFIKEILAPSFQYVDQPIWDNFPGTNMHSVALHLAWTSKLVPPRNSKGVWRSARQRHELRICSLFMSLLRLLREMRGCDVAFKMMRPYSLVQIQTLYLLNDQHTQASGLHRYIGVIRY